MGELPFSCQVQLTHRRGPATPAAVVGTVTILQVQLEVALLACRLGVHLLTLCVWRSGSNRGKGNNSPAHGHMRTWEFKRAFREFLRHLSTFQIIIIQQFLPSPRFIA
jgi:hypothetical protein